MHERSETRLSKAGTSVIYLKCLTSLFLSSSFIFDFLTFALSLFCFSLCFIARSHRSRKCRRCWLLNFSFFHGLLLDERFVSRLQRAIWSSTRSNNVEVYMVYIVVFSAKTPSFLCILDISESRGISTFVCDSSDIHTGYQFLRLAK